MQAICRSSIRLNPKITIKQLPAQAQSTVYDHQMEVGCLFWIDRRREDTKHRFCSSMIWFMDRTADNIGNSIDPRLKYILHTRLRDPSVPANQKTNKGKMIHITRNRRKNCSSWWRSRTRASSLMITILYIHTTPFQIK